MLQSLRKSAGSLVAKVLFGLLVLSFAVWGIGDTFFFGGAGNVVAEVGDREITVRELDRAFRNEVNRLRQFNIDDQQARQLGVLDQVLERMISTSVYDEAARNMGLTVGDPVLQERIRRQFGANITPAEFQAILRNNGMSEAQFVAALRGDIVRSEYVGTLTAGAAAPKVLVDRLYAWRSEKRAAAVITIPVDPQSTVPEPTTEQIESYYKGHPGDYTAPEYRALSYVFLDPKSEAGKIKVADEKLRELYEQRKGDFVVPERRTVLQMLVPDQATAEKAIDRLRLGEDFIAVAKEVAGQDESATRLGTVTQDELPKEIAGAVFALKKDAISAPVTGPFGLQIVKVTAIEPGTTRSFDAVRAELAKDAATEAAIDSILGLTNRLEESLGLGATLPEAAKELGIPLHTIAATDREGQDRDENAIPDIPGAPFLQVAFETEDGRDSLLHETSDNGFFVLRVDSITPATLRPLDRVRAEVIDDWKSEQRWKAAREKAKNIVERLNNGAKIADIAAELDLAVETSDGLTRSGEGAPANMPPGLVADIFAASSVGRAALADGVGGINVAQLTGIERVGASENKQAADQLQSALGNGIANDIASQLVNALRARYGVSVNQAAIQANFFNNAGDS